MQRYETSGPVLWHHQGLANHLIVSSPQGQKLPGELWQGLPTGQKRMVCQVQIYVRMATSGSRIYHQGDHKFVVYNDVRRRRMNESGCHNMRNISTCCYILTTTDSISSSKIPTTFKNISPAPSYEKHSFLHAISHQPSHRRHYYHHKSITTTIIIIIIALE